MIPARRFTVQRTESPLPEVSATAWRRLVDALETQPQRAVTRTGALGMYAITPRRLIELGYAENLRTLKTDDRQLSVCDFVGEWTQEKFLADPVAQYAALVKSMRLYYDALRRGDLVRPEGASMSGALAVLHVGGRGALSGWPKLFANTQAIYDAAKAAF